MDSLLSRLNTSGRIIIGLGAIAAVLCVVILSIIGKPHDVEAACNLPASEEPKVATFTVTDTSSVGDSETVSLADTSDIPGHLYICGDTATIELDVTMASDPATKQYVGWRVEDASGNLIASSGTPATATPNEGNMISCAPSAATLTASDSMREFYVKIFCDEEDKCSKQPDENYLEDELEASGPKDFEIIVIFIKVNIAPGSEFVPTNYPSTIVYSLTSDSYTPAGITWALAPSSLFNGAMIVASSDTDVEIYPGIIETNYVILAFSNDKASCYDDAELEVGCCESGESENVTLTYMSLPPYDEWNEPFFAWSDYTSVFARTFGTNVVARLFEDSLGDKVTIGPVELGIPDLKQYFGKYYIDKCCVDCDLDCWQIGEYRRRSVRTDFNWPCNLDLSKTVLQYAASIGGAALSVLPSSITSWMSFNASVAVPIGVKGRLKINDWWSLETDECEDCPSPELPCPQAVTNVNDCLTGYDYVGLQFTPFGVDMPITAPGGSTFAASVKTHASGVYIWRGSRIGLQNMQNTSYRGHVYIRWSLGRLGGLIDLYGPEDVPFGPPSVKNLCM